MIFVIRCAITKIAAVTGIAALGLGLGLGASAASAASAAATVKPVVIYNDSNGWATPTVKPSHIYIGEGGAPIVYKLKWSHWTITAYATGTLNEQRAGCTTPTYLCPTVNYPVGVTLQHVKTHDGTRYFATMKWSWYAGGKHHVQWLVAGPYWNEI
jgi:hypothetical protein